MDAWSKALEAVDLAHSAIEAIPEPTPNAPADPDVLAELKRVLDRANDAVVEARRALVLARVVGGGVQRGDCPATAEQKAGDKPLFA